MRGILLAGTGRRIVDIVCHAGNTGLHIAAVFVFLCIHRARLFGLV
jgi:hypothetical protein